jgi:hypothetical protein
MQVSNFGTTENTTLYNHDQVKEDYSLFIVCGLFVGFFSKRRREGECLWCARYLRPCMPTRRLLVLSQTPTPPKLRTRPRDNDKARELAANMCGLADHDASGDTPRHECSRPSLLILVRGGSRAGDKDRGQQLLAASPRTVSCVYGALFPLSFSLVTFSSPLFVNIGPFLSFLVHSLS